MSVENLMHPPKKCHCDCCNCQPKTYGPLPKAENNHEFLKQLGKMIAEVMSNGEKQTLLTSPPKQAIPDGWQPIEKAPKDGTQVIIKCSGGRVATAFYDDKPFVGEGWHVVVPFLGGFGSGTDTFIFFPEDMPTHWMPIPPAPTNTEVGE
ncbi:hypothetical protein [Methylotenera sp.]|uniref:hypothetical protein n=1 Tax=Methylotenera sp. TaxID=2051956 RepID=UPI002ED80F16